MSLTQSFLQLTLLGAEWVLWLLVLLSVASVAVMIERWLFLRGVEAADRDLGGRLWERLSAGDTGGARELVRNACGAGGRIVAHMLDRRDLGEAAVSAAMVAARPQEKLRLERYLIVLGTVGANAPFVGLFGTVLGIIKAFKDLSEAGNLAAVDNAQVVMAGISEALVATAMGLLVAIPAVVAYNYFQRRVKRILGDADGLTAGVHALVVDRIGAASRS
jgi:biopolymer transport protein ExbB